MAALSGGHYIFALWFLPFCLFSSPNLSRCRLDVYHTSTHGVALCKFRMQVWNVRGSLEIQDTKNRHFGTITQLCQAISSELRHWPTF